MPTSDYTPSDAAKAYASRPQMSGDCGDSIRRAFDAGCAHALATVTPRTISTESELDALPVGSVVTDGDRDAWQKNRDGEWVMCGCEGAYSSRHVFSDAELKHPVTLLVPATAFPEPVRLTDPDDPRIRVGALVQSDSYDSIGGYSTVIYRYLLDDKPTAGGFTCGTVAYVRAQIAGGSRNYSLLAEAPTDPDAGAREALTYAADGARLGDDDMLGRLRHHGYDITKRADA